MSMMAEPTENNGYYPNYQCKLNKIFMVEERGKLHIYGWGKGVI